MEKEKLIELVLKEVLLENPHLCIGQEASIVGVCANLKKDDYVTGVQKDMAII